MITDSIFSVYREQYRSVSFAGGAEETWRTVVTLPNIIRLYSPSVRGGSTGTGDENSQGAKLNLAS